MFIQFKNYPEKIPKFPGNYLCRVIETEGKNKGEISYRVDNYEEPSVFQEKYEGIIKGFQGDFQDTKKVNGFASIEDDYISKHTITFDLEDRCCKLFINGEELVIYLSRLKHSNINDEFPKIDYYIINGFHGEKNISYSIKIYIFENGNIEVVLPEFKEILESKDSLLIDFYKNYFSEKILYYREIDLNNS